MFNFGFKVQFIFSTNKFDDSIEREVPGVGLLKYDLGRDMPLRLEKRTHFIPNFAEK